MFAVTDLPSYSASLITAVATPQQGIPFPKFVMGGRGGASGTTYGLFKQSTTYGFNLWRSEVFHVGVPFVVTAITIPLHTLVAANMRIQPILRFDNGKTASAGTEINSTNYPNSDKTILLVADNFSSGVKGNYNFYLELQFLGTVLLPVSLPIKIDIETETTV